MEAYRKFSVTLQKALAIIRQYGSLRTKLHLLASAKTELVVCLDLPTVQPHYNDPHYNAVFHITRPCFICYMSIVNNLIVMMSLNTTGLLLCTSKIVYYTVVSTFNFQAVVLITGCLLGVKF